MGLKNELDKYSQEAHALHYVPITQIWIYSPKIWPHDLFCTDWV